MAEQDDLISQYINKAGLESDTKFFVEQLKTVQAQVEALKKALIGVEGSVGTKGFSKASKEAKVAVDDLDKSKKKLIDTELKAAKVTTEEAKARKLNAEAALKEAAAIDKQNKAKKGATSGPVQSVTTIGGVDEAAAAAKVTGTAINDLNRAEAEAILSAKQWAAAQQQAAAATTKSGTAAKLSATEINRLKEQNQKIAIEDKVIAQQQTTLLKAQIREENSVKGSLEQRRAALIRLNAVYDNQSPQERASASGQRLQKILGGLSTQVKTLEADTGRAQRNVGNYANAFQKAFGVLRNLAYVLPGIGIAGILGLISDGVIALGKAAFSSARNIGSLSDIFDRTADIMDTAKESYASASANVTKLSVDIDLAKKGFIDKDVVVKEYNETLGKTTGFVKSLDEAEKALTKNAEAYIRFTFLKAVATEAFSRAGKEAVEVELQNQKDLQTIGNLSKSKSNDGLDEFLERGLKNERAAREANGQKRVKIINDIGAKYEKEAAQLAAKFNFKFDPLTGTNKKDQELKAIQKEFDSDELESTKEHQEDLSKVVSLALTTRLAARKNAAEAEKAIIEGNRDVEIQNEIDKLNAVKNQKSVGANELINATNEFNAAVAKIEKEADKKLLKAQERYQNDRLDIQVSGSKKERDQLAADAALYAQAQEQAYQKQLAAAQSRGDKESQTITKSHETDVTLLNKKYDKQFDLVANNEKKTAKLTEQYAFDRGELEFNAAKRSAENQIQVATDVIAAKKSNNQAVGDDEAKLAQLQINLSDTVFEHERSVQKRKRNLRELDLQETAAAIEKIGQFTSQAFNIIGAAIDNSIIGDKNRIQAQIDLLEEKSDREIQLIEKSTLAESEKADQISIIEASRDSKRRALERKQKEADERRARFEKTQAIAGIVVNTALAVVKALPNIPLAVLAGILGAAQLAIAIAQPIPKYRTGKKNHPGGPAILGDGRKKEFVELPSGESFITPAKDTLYDLPKGSHVYPDAEKHLEMIHQRALRTRPALANTQVDQMGRLVDAVSKEGRLTRDAIKNKRELHLVGDYASAVAIHKHQAGELRYVEEMVRFKRRR